MNDDNQFLTSIDPDKLLIINLFMASVIGNTADTTLANINHDGKEGHWLEAAMGLALNSNNSPDILGYEMKNGTASKTSFGDWSADYYLYKQPLAAITRSDFLHIFGKSNLKKDGRFSWSGEPCPKIRKYNPYGQILYIDKENNIYAVYDYAKDCRDDKHLIVPKRFQLRGLILAKWSAALMRKRVENKFNQKGWFKCERNAQGIYTAIAFGDPITFEIWINLVKTGFIFFDSGMYDGNERPYSQWRAENKLWNSLVTSRFS